MEKKVIFYKLDAFEGPLDLLLHLIEKNKIDIYDIPISEITEQYLEYMKALEEEDLEIVSAFLLMAVTLLEMKARMLLPKKEEEEGEEVDPREELVQRLLEYKKYKRISGMLRTKEETAPNIIEKDPRSGKVQAAFGPGGSVEGLGYSSPSGDHEGDFKAEGSQKGPASGKLWKD